MAYEQHSGPAFPYPVDSRHALGLEVHIAYGKSFIHDQDFGVYVDGTGEGQAHVHTTGIHLHRLVDEIPYLCKGYDARQLILHLFPAEPCNHAVKENIIQSAQLRVETRAEFQQGRDTPFHRHLPAARLEHTGYDAQQGGFAAAVPAQYPHRLPLFDLKTHVAQRIKILVVFFAQWM